MRREPAWRVFAGEFNDSSFEIKGRGEKAPSYVVTPLGAKINRLFAIGVLTDVENVSEGGEFLRAHISDPTGVFTLYSGQYQQEVTDILANIDPPVFVAVLGKAKTYSPEEGTLFVSIRPETVQEISVEIRDRWILETCKHTKDRVEAISEALKMNQPNIVDLRKLGFSRDLSDGVISAVNNYGKVDVHRYLNMVSESLQYLVPGQQKQMDLHREKKVDKPLTKKKPKEEKTESKKEDDGESEDSQEVENTVLKTIESLQGDDGASWDEIVKSCEKKGLDNDSIEEALTSLMDKGFIYEPVLGTIKTT